MHVPLVFVQIVPVVWYENEFVASPALLGPVSVPEEDFPLLYPAVIRIWCIKKYLYSGETSAVEQGRVVNKVFAALKRILSCSWVSFPVAPGLGNILSSHFISSSNFLIIQL